MFCNQGIQIRMARRATYKMLGMVHECCLRLQAKNVLLVAHMCTHSSLCQLDISRGHLHGASVF